MYKKPPDEDRTREYPEITYPAQRRKRSDATYKQPSNAFHADEHPEIPKVRRASLNLDKQPTNPSPGSEFIQAQSPFFTRLQPLSNSRKLMIICIVALIIVTSSQIILNLSHNHIGI